MRILEGEGVTKRFGGLAAVEQMDFHVDQGEVVGLIGPNGAGKTTLFNLISGVLVPKPGRIEFKSENITGLKPNQICRKGVARTFQSVKVFSNMPVFGNIYLAALFGNRNNLTSAEAAQEATDLLEFVGLSAVRSSSAQDLTLANQKRLEVGRALATKPELLLLDEVMAGLNETEVAQTMELVNKIREEGITIVMIEHIMRAIMNVCDRIIVLHHGKKIAEGSPEEIATNETVVQVYLGE